MIVCVCRVLSDHAIRAAIAGGAFTVEDAGAACRAHILEGEEKHANWIEAQLTLIEQVGEGNYLAQQIKDEE